MKGQLKELAVLNTLKNIRNEYNMRLEQIKNDIFCSVEYSFNFYNIYAVPVLKHDMVMFDSFLYPLINNPEEQNLFDREAFSDKNELFVEDIFIEEELSKILEFDGGNFSGIIVTDLGLFEAEFQLRVNGKYFKAIENLYMLTERNKISWRTLNIPYITKFMSVYLVKTEDRFFESSEITVIDYNLDLNYKKDYILCWNVKKNMCIPGEMVKPAEERLIYEYTVNTDIFGKYLADLDEGEIFSSHVISNEQLKFITDKKITKNLMLWEITGGLNSELLKYLEYPVYGNEINREYKKYNLYNTEDIEEIISNFKNTEDIKLNKVFSGFSDEKIIKIVDLNGFLKEEFKIKGKQTPVYLDLEYKKTYLSNEIISYILSELELRYKEFKFSVLESGGKYGIYK
jgi:hypothetical protein